MALPCHISLQLREEKRAQRPKGENFQKRTHQFDQKPDQLHHKEQKREKELTLEQKKQFQNFSDLAFVDLNWWVDLELSFDFHPPDLLIHHGQPPWLPPWLYLSSSKMEKIRQNFEIFTITSIFPKYEDFTQISLLSHTEFVPHVGRQIFCGGISLEEPTEAFKMKFSFLRGEVELDLHKFDSSSSK
jgi:hypothetical protein